MSKNPLVIQIPAAPIVEIQHEILQNRQVSLHLLREDLNHPLIQGNKFRKLKYNLIEAHAQGHQTLLTFGGAYSNHIHATAAAGKAFGFKTIGVIRGDELKNKPRNATLKEAEQMGMKLHFVTRKDYRRKSQDYFIDDLHDLFGDFYLVPEGGTNDFAIKGCEEILHDGTKGFDYIACAMGTAGTFTGILKSSESHQKVLGFPALKEYEFLLETVKKYTNKTNYEIINAFHFGGFGKFNRDLISFVNDFKENQKIQLEPLYTGKMLFGILDLVEKDYFKPNSKILAVHTGGLQGIKGFNERFKNKYNIDF
ncbi:pyridoxal-phosphate dependent enzyme [Ornithobacterium rhinotracheale]|uniref:1-aminocyclopropane-1-carboxylate deaminase/D-cysteine desulfhydrase n=2 Tax=Ornithobacterium rhinotracheale TaxID=28251 RepID=UPI001629C461|nr:pyridoxal-phosphate dependent enzyme [Ornithobacterium rhinotracheale]UOH77762.1 pyridoxal-phosphate dependent enzyme [Ornithobacterium rhinotracheale]